MAFKFKAALCALAAMSFATAASAQTNVQRDGDYYTFALYNGTPWTILTFQTGRPNGTYSQDWIPTRVLSSGDEVRLRFYDSEDACEYYVKVTFEDGDEWERRLDFCALERVNVTEDGIEAEE